MRIVEVVREAWRDVLSGAGWALTAALVLAVLLAGIVGVRAVAVAADVRGARAYVAGGAATLVQRAEGRIDGRACDALGASDGVLASGGLRRIDDGVVPAVLPRSEVPTYEVTRGFPRLLGSDADADTVVGGPAVEAGVLVSASVRDGLGLERGGVLTASDGRSAPVTGVYAYPDDGRDPDLEYAVLAPVLDDERPFDACWATVWPQRDDTVPALRRTVLPATGAEGEDRPTVGQLNPRLGERFVPAAAPTAAVPFAAALVAGVAVGGAAVFRRRLALAADRHIGVGRSAQALGIVVQHTVWAAAAAVAAVGTAIVVVRGLAVDDAVPIVLGAAAVAVVGTVGALLGGVVAVLSVRERALHRYFRSR